MMRLKDMNIPDIDVPDIPTMFAMTEAEYKAYLEGDGLFFLDHHEVLREATTGRSLATSLEQLEILIEKLEECRGRMHRWNKDSPPPR